MRRVDRDSSIAGRELGTDPFAVVETDPIVGTRVDGSIDIAAGDDNTNVVLVLLLVYVHGAELFFHRFPISSSRDRDSGKLTICFRPVVLLQYSPTWLHVIASLAPASRISNLYRRRNSRRLRRVTSSRLPVLGSFRASMVAAVVVEVVPLACWTLSDPFTVVDISADSESFSGCSSVCDVLRRVAEVV